MNHHPNHVRLAEQLLEDLDNPIPAMIGTDRRIPVSHYTCPRRFESEAESLFQQRPVIVAHGSQLAEPGACITHDLTGIPVIIVRDRDGELRGFLNACRHRSTRLVNRSPCAKHAFICPYHGWRYDLAGKLTHVPHADAFPTLEAEKYGLVPVAVDERYGFIWLTARADTAMNASDYLGPIGDELDGLSLATHAPYKRFDATCDANWKFTIEGFLEAYHVKHLHRETIDRFFFDSRFRAERVGPHIRTGIARRTLPRAHGADKPSWHIPELMTVTYLLFPNTVIIVSLEGLLQFSAFPLTPSKTHWSLSLLIPESPSNDEERAHWDKIFDYHLKVFGQEDIPIGERVQAGLRTGANDALTFGRLEYAIQWFHEAVMAAVESVA